MLDTSELRGPIMHQTSHSQCASFSDVPSALKFTYTWVPTDVHGKRVYVEDLVIRALYKGTSKEVGGYIETRELEFK